MAAITKVDRLTLIEKPERVDEFEIDEDGNFAYTIGKTIFFRKIGSKSSTEAIELTGHHSNITALRFGTIASLNGCLVSAGSFYVILWDLDAVRSMHDNGKEVRGSVLVRLEGLPTIDLQISPNLERIAVTNKEEVTVYDVKSKSLIWSQFGNISIKSCFLDKDSLAITRNGSRIEIWNIKENIELWKSCNITNEITFLWKESVSRFGIGCSNNSLMVFSQSSNSDWKKSYSIDLDMEMFRYQSTKYDERYANSEILAVSAVTEVQSNESHSFRRGLVICATSQSIFIIDSQTQEVEILSLSLFDIDFISAISFVQTADISITAVTVPLFKDDFEIIRIDVNASQEDISLISVIPNIPLIENSILKRTLTPTKNVSKGRKHAKRPSLTFHDKIRSSGYNKKPENRKMFVPVTSQLSKSKFTSVPKKTELPSSTNSYVEWSRNIELSAVTSTCDRPSNINHISISECNRFLSSSLLNSTCFIMGRKSQKHVGTLKGHDGSVNTTSWNYDSTVLLTCSNDRTAKLWNLSNFDQPIMNVELKYGCFSKSPEKFSQAISYGQFYYMDKFLMLSFGSSFGLYSYYIDHGPRDDVKRYLDKNKYKLVKLFDLSEAQSITCLASPNNLYSYTALVCGSDKTAHVFDMNTAVCCRKMDNIHTRPASHLILNTGSLFSQPVSHDLFFTTAPTDGIKLWDLRSSRCSAKLKAHADSQTNWFDVAPNGCYLATSGDDAKIHVYDIRKMEMLQSSKQQKDKVSSVQFSKDGEQLHIGLRNGHVCTLHS